MILGGLARDTTGAVAPPPFKGSLTLQQDLLYYWKLIEASGTRVASAGTKNLLVSGTVLAERSLGLFQGQNVAVFTGSNGLYQTPIFWNTPPWTVSVWGKRTSASTERELIHNTDGFGTGMSISTEDTTAYFQTFSGIFSLHTVTRTVASPTSWNHYFASMSSSYVMTYSINDGTATTTSAGGYASATTLYVGSSSAAAAGWVGDIGELGIWNRVLTSTERTALYNLGAGLFY